MIIDAHHHLLTEPGYLDRLADACAELNIDKVCLFGAGRQHLQYGITDNAAVLDAMAKRPELIVPFAVFELGVDNPGLIDEFVHQGFKGVKVINPTKNYDDKGFHPVYGRIEGHGIPVLFHLGIVARNASDKVWDINNNRQRPIYLDTIARAFPDMTLIGAHFGNPWYDEAGMACRWNPNLYFDLSGSTLKKKSAQALGELLWWTPTTRYKDPLGRHAWEKIVFGADVHAREIDDVLGDYNRVMAELELDPELREKVLGGTMAGLLKLNDGG